MDGRKGMMPEISVITAFFNEERFLAEAIESVIGQHYDSWELILVDDGSADSSTDIAQEYAARYPGKISCVQHERGENKGLSASRNLGISRARGALIAFLDADDVWRREKLQVQAGIMHACPQAAMLCEASEYWYSWEKPSAQDVIIPVGVKREGLFDPPELINLLYPLSGGAAPCPSGIIVRRSALEKYRGFEAHFTGKYQLYEDQAFLHKIYLNEPVYISPLCHNRYRQRAGSLVRQVTGEGNYHVVRQYFLQWLREYMAEHKIVYPGIDNLLRRALCRYRHPVVRWWARLFY
ncbi:glycosyl transferase family 2 [Anseongella ginsenosidimutans]|uniref:Glycosyl transferase family 2 n=1 Tax=Anseongella ginsenosidimutans TaxID=496056 RepID=A0A4R3KXE7_9SPHI|nr:glycosyltransferase family 2 protein [Anseongella ginsenosidimutans]QEC51208.1 glycosyltransferase family 2 protein [Anseongella ginsenosidimutans]TCS90118.1 glycosyl transferase family 2 [Anseongella ginsenosidimutans]